MDAPTTRYILQATCWKLFNATCRALDSAVPVAMRIAAMKLIEGSEAGAPVPLPPTAPAPVFSSSPPPPDPYSAPLYGVTYLDEPAILPTPQQITKRLPNGRRIKVSSIIPSAIAAVKALFYRRDAFTRLAIVIDAFVPSLNDYKVSAEHARRLNDARYSALRADALDFWRSVLPRMRVELTEKNAERAVAFTPRFEGYEDDATTHIHRHDQVPLILFTTHLDALYNRAVSDQERECVFLRAIAACLHEMGHLGQRVKSGNVDLPYMTPLHIRGQRATRKSRTSFDRFGDAGEPIEELFAGGLMTLSTGPPDPHGIRIILQFGPRNADFGVALDGRVHTILDALLDQSPISTKCSPFPFFPLPSHYDLVTSAEYRSRFNVGPVPRRLGSFTTSSSSPVPPSASHNDLTESIRNRIDAHACSSSYARPAPTLSPSPAEPSGRAIPSTDSEEAGPDTADRSQLTEEGQDSSLTVNDEGESGEDSDLEWPIFGPHNTIGSGNF